MHGGLPGNQRHIGQVQVRRLRGPQPHHRQRQLADHIRSAALIQRQVFRLRPRVGAVQGCDADVQGEPADFRLALAAYADVHPGRFLVDISLHPDIVHPGGRRCLQLNITIKPAKAVKRCHAPLAAGRIVADGRHNFRRGARGDQVGDVVFIRAAIGVQMGDALLIHPEPGLRAHTAHFQPDPFSSPVFRDLDRAPVARRAHIDVIQGPGDTIERQIPRQAHPWFTDPLCLPASGHLDRSGAVPIRLIPSRPFPHAVPAHQARIYHEVPFTAQRDDFLQG